VADLNGQIRVLLNGKVDADPQKGLRNTFEAVPDAPVSKFVLELKGGPKKGLLVNSKDICRSPQSSIAMASPSRDSSGRVSTVDDSVRNSPSAPSATPRSGRR
jgi:hypothetical protein